jgi:hypothetical protein
MATDIVAINGSSLSKNNGIAKFSNLGDTTMIVGSVIDFRIILDNPDSAVSLPVCSKGTITETGKNNYRLTLTNEIGINEEFSIDYALNVELEKTTKVTVEIVGASGETNTSNNSVSITYTHMNTSGGKLIAIAVFLLLLILGIRKYKQLTN